jgi:elongation factor G
VPARPPGADPRRHRLVPSECTARALQLVTQRRGQILGYEGKAGWGGWDEIRANIPQGDMHDLIVSLRSLSQGTASSTGPTTTSRRS